MIIFAEIVLTVAKPVQIIRHACNANHFFIMKS